MTYSLLQTFYNRAIVPPTSPEKLNHGDIDVLVDSPLPDFNQRNLMQAIGAVRVKHAGGITSFAIPAPGCGEFFQVDVNVCGRGGFEWGVVMHSWGDLWHIIGKAVGRFGFVIDDKGLCLRVGEIEKTNRKGPILRLTSSVGEMMGFLGLDEARYAEGFANFDEVFGWAVSCRFFRRGFFEREGVSVKERRVRDKRAMYDYFVSEWLPQQAKLGLCDLTHDGDGELGDRSWELKLREEALGVFGMRMEYEILLKEYREKVFRNEMWGKIADALPLDGKELGRVMVALKKRLWWNDGPGFLPATADRSVELILAFDARTVDKIVVPWVLDHWTAV